MNKNQKILTVICTIALTWACLCLAGSESRGYGSGDGGPIAAVMLAIVVLYIGLFFVLKTTKKPD